MMDARTLEQARIIYRTVRQLRARIMREHASLQIAAGSDGLCHDLTVPQLNMLTVIGDRGSVTIKELAKALQVSPPSASAMVDRLVEIGAVTREQNPDDRREVIVGMSPQVEEIISRIEERFLKRILELLDKIGAEYAAKWCDVFERVLEVLAEERDAVEMSE